MRIVALAAACLATACAAAPGGTGNAPVPYEVLSSGPHSGVYNPYFTVIQDSDRFASIWQRAQARQYPSPAPPAINFSRYMIIAVFLGEKRTGGYNIKVANLVRTPTGLAVIVRERHPGAGCATTQALTQPFAIIRTPIVVGAIQFKKQIVSEPCD